MCTSIVEDSRVTVSGKGPLGRFNLDQASVSYDHPDHDRSERAVIIDFLSETVGCMANVGSVLQAVKKLRGRQIESCGSGQPS